MVSLKSFLAVVTLTSATFAFPIKTRTTASKRGLAFNSQTKLDLFNNHGLTWSYNWNPTHDGEQSLGEYVPMLSSEKDVTALAGLGNVDHLLGFNEPDQDSQANMSPDQAVRYYEQDISPYHGQASLGSPAITSSEDSGKGLNWMDQFLDQCNGACNIDFMVTHWYGNNDSGEQNADAFLSYVDRAVDLAQKYGINKIWITEFGFGYNSLVPRSQRADFLRRVLPALDANSAVERYAYFFDLNLQSGGDALGEEALVYVA
ncbi:hypothetical protein KEM56_000955 [Ascosphaera pollenicola]|nr:hypothetical protein KEM56_000955 [Ascosphaera pollenicola]